LLDLLGYRRAFFLPNQLRMIVSSLFHEYAAQPGFWDEMSSDNGIRTHYQKVFNSLQNLPIQSLHEKDALASELFMNQGITFTVYNDNSGIERIFPFDILPRIITHNEWEHIEAGIRQRITALNRFLCDIYGKQQIIADGVIPAALISSCSQYTREVHGIKVMHDIYVHVAGIDLIRAADGVFYILEDNLRTPSGVSYMLENREVTKRIFPEMFAANSVRMVNNYPLLLHNILNAHSPRQTSKPTVVLLTPGIFNSAFYEHSFLARQMGIPLVEGRDLVVNNQTVYMKTTSGLQRVDVIYRRIDDEYLDPLEFKPDSLLGVPGILNAYRKGNVAIINAVGNGVADDKAVYVYVPDMIRYYLNEEPILPNVPTYQASDPDQLNYILQNIHRMVVKKTDQSGGYGMLMGNSASDEQIHQVCEDMKKHPRNYIAQPILTLSTVPCFLQGKIVPRHVDLRPYALCGPNGIQIVPGGLTRVALREGSLIVNSSQGGGSKDTWIID